MVEANGATFPSVAMAAKEEAAMAYVSCLLSDLLFAVATSMVHRRADFGRLAFDPLEIESIGALALARRSA